MTIMTAAIVFRSSRALGKSSHLLFYILCTFSFQSICGTKSNAVHFKVNPEKVCPCSNPDWCQPIVDTSRKEVFVFSVTNDEKHWNLYDWSKLTSVVMFGYVNTTLMCLAHSHNVRALFLGSVDEKTLINETARSSWVKRKVQIAKDNWLDGINFDYESAIYQNQTNIRDAYTQLVKETHEAFKKEMPFSQVSVDVAWRPNQDSRYYDYVGLTEDSDILFVMAYDEQSQIWSECVAMPNSGLGAGQGGLFTYMWNYAFQGKISPNKLVFGVPWYGYKYPCIRLKGDTCYIKKVPFRGVGCSDAAGSQVNYDTIWHLLKSGSFERKWNATSQTPYFTYTDEKSKILYQVQYDDPVSLAIKYHEASKMGLRGVGMWNIDSLDYSDSSDAKLIRRTMFDALPSYKREPSPKKNFLDCPCEDPKLCEPIKEIPEKEIFLFSTENKEEYWANFNWSKITTVCMFNYFNPKLVCLAHSHNVRVVMHAQITSFTLSVPMLRSAWVDIQAKAVREKFMDGFNFDYEDRVRIQDKLLRDGFTAAVKELSQALREDNPYAQVSVDFPYRPNIPSLQYDYKAIAEVADFLFIMGYDDQYSVTGPYLAGPNADYPAISDGIDLYMTMEQFKIPASKLVLGVPWYGYKFLCAKLQGDECHLNKSVPNAFERLRGSIKPGNTALNGVGDTGSYIMYFDIYKLVDARPEIRKWNATSRTPFLTFQDNESGKWFQIQYDDPESLALKYNMAAKKNIRGVGMWTVDFLDYSNSPAAVKSRHEMFDILPNRPEGLHQ